MTEGVTAGGSLLFGLLIPNLGETEIFGPICQVWPNRRNGATTPCCGGISRRRRRERKSDIGTVPAVRCEKSGRSVFCSSGAHAQNDRINQAASRGVGRSFDSESFCWIGIFCRTRAAVLMTLLRSTIVGPDSWPPNTCSSSAASGSPLSHIPTPRRRWMPELPGTAKRSLLRVCR